MCTAHTLPLGLSLNWSSLLDVLLDPHFLSMVPACDKLWRRLKQATCLAKFAQLSSLKHRLSWIQSRVSRRLWLEPCNSWLTTNICWMYQCATANFSKRLKAVWEDCHLVPMTSRIACFVLESKFQACRWHRFSSEAIWLPRRPQTSSSGLKAFVASWLRWKGHLQVLSTDLPGWEHGWSGPKKSWCAKSATSYQPFSCAPHWQRFTALILRLFAGAAAMSSLAALAMSTTVPALVGTPRLSSSKLEKSSEMMASTSESTFLFQIVVTKHYVESATNTATVGLPSARRYKTSLVPGPTGCMICSLGEWPNGLRILVVGQEAKIILAKTLLCTADTCRESLCSN